MPPPVTAVRHLKIWLSDLAASRAWYERVFGLVHETDFPEPDGTVLGSLFLFPGSQLHLAIRQDSQRAKAPRDADPFALALSPEELDQWMQHLDALHIWHPPRSRHRAAGPPASATQTACRCACTPTSNGRDCWPGRLFR